METLDDPFESTRSPATEEASVIPDHLVLPDGDALLRPHVPAPRTRRGWVYPVPETPDFLPNPIQAGWFQGWTLSLPGAGALPTPAVHDGAVFLSGGADSRDIFAVDAATGIPLWTVRLSEGGPGQPVVSGRYIVVSTRSGSTFVLSAFDGSMVWSRRHPGGGDGEATVYEELVYRGVPGPDGDLLVASALSTGAPHWEASLDGQILGAPVVRERALYVTTTEGSVYCFEPETGLERWSEPLGAWGPPCAEGTQIFVACANPWTSPGDAGSPGLLRVTLSAGLPYERVVWGQREAGDPVRLVSRLSVGLGFSGVPAAGYPMPGDGRMEAAGSGPDQGSAEAARSRPWASGDDICLAGPTSIRCADLRAGSLRWEWSPPMDQGPAEISGPPAVGPTLVVAASTTGDLAGLRRRDGEVQWTLRLGEPVMSAPVLANGWLYVTTTRGRVFGVDLRDASSPNAPAD